MGTNKSKYTKEDLTEIRRAGKNSQTRQERIDNRNYRKSMARRTRRVEKQELDRILNDEDEDYDEALDFYKR